MIDISLRSRLINSAHINSNVAVHLNINHNSNDNYIVVNVINDESNIDVQLNTDFSEARVQIDCFSKDLEQVRMIAKNVSRELNKSRYTDQYVFVHVIRKEDQIPEYEADPRLHKVSIDFRILYYEV